MMIQLIPITNENRADCEALKVAPAQMGFVLSNAESLEEARQFSELHPLGICEAGKMKGFLMYSVDARGVCLWRLMVDERYQRQGIGKTALRVFVRLVCEKHPGMTVFTTVEPDNPVAISLYEKAGFRRNGQVYQGELVMVLSQRFI